MKSRKTEHKTIIVGVTDEHQKQVQTLQRYHNYQARTEKKRTMSHIQRAGKSRQDVKTDGQCKQKHGNSRSKKKKNSVVKNLDLVD